MKAVRICHQMELTTISWAAEFYFPFARASGKISVEVRGWHSFGPDSSLLFSLVAL